MQYLVFKQVISLTNMFRLLIYIFLFQTIQAQVGIGEWSMHVPLNKGNQLAISPNKVFLSTNYSLLEYDKTTFEVTEWSKINGLSDNGVVSVSYSDSQNKLIIGYQSGNIDFFSNGSIDNVSDIKRYPISTSKSINHIYIHNEEAYLSCGFGIVVLDLIKKEIKDTYYIGNNASFLNVNQVLIIGEMIYASTSNGLMESSLNLNLADFNNWELNSFFEGKTAGSMTMFDSKLLVNQIVEGFSNDTVWINNLNDWSYIETPETDDFYIINSSNEKLYLPGNYKIYEFDDQFNLTNSIYTYEGVSPEPNLVVADKNDNDYWIADRGVGLVLSKGIWSQDFLSPNNVNYEFAYAMEGINGKVWTVGGGMQPSGENTWNRNSAQLNLENSWSSFNFENQEQVNDTIYDIVDVSINPSDDSDVYFASWGRGLIKSKNGVVQAIYRDHNSLLEAMNEEGFYQCRIGAIDFDEESRLWIANTGAEENLKMKDGDDWYSFDLGGISNSSKSIIDIMASSSLNQVWLAFNSGDVAVYDHKGTIDDQSDDEVQLINTNAGSGNLVNQYVNVIKEDKDGEVWLGTNEGVSVFFNPSQIFEGGNEWDAQEIVIEQGDYLQNLLESSVVTELLVDGANQKWFGTENDGVYLFSEDGQEQIHHFTSENSPLLSNNVQSMAIQSNSGEVFIATDKGIISFRGVATESNDNFNNVYAFPNPVRPGYTGNIGIDGLFENTLVKITDLSGNLVFETRSEGGQASWDGRRINGEFVSSGVYLVHCSNEDGTHTVATKILIVR